MSEAAEAAQQLSGQERALQKFLMGTTVTVKGGGGFVFPRGFFGIGYRLSEWQFDRYRAAVDQTMLSAEAAKRKKVMFGAVVIYFVVILAVSFSLPKMQADPALAPYVGLWTPIITVLLAAAALIAVSRLVRRRAMPFMQHLEDAPRVGRFTFLRERALALLASGHVRLPVLYIRILLYCALVVVLLATNLFAEDRPALRIGVSLLLLLSTAQRMFFVLVYWSFRRRNGRAPRLDDLQPVEAPAARAV